MQDFLGLASLFFFSMASAGFVLFMLRYPHGSTIRTWGIRMCHGFGFMGVALLRLSRGHFNEASLLVISSLIVSLLSFEMSRRYLR